MSSDDIDLRDGAGGMEPGSNLAELKRRSDVAPVPPPALPAEETQPLLPDALTEDEPVVTPPIAAASKRATTSPKRAGKPAAAHSDDLVGTPRGNLQQISFRLPVEMRERLGQESAGRDETLGECTMAAVRSTHRQLREEFGSPVVDDGFGVPLRRKRRRSVNGSKLVTAVLITPEEARALQTLSDDLSMSISRTIEESLRRAWAAEG